jgi:hypothetical protein
MGFFDPGSGVLAGVLSGTPSVPAWNDINLNQMQTSAIGANQASLPALENLATGVNTFNQQQLTELFNNIMPGFSNMSSKVMENISNELSGKLPSDVAGNIQSSAAAQALTGGFGGSGLAGNMTAKDLGISSLQLMGQGQSSLESWTSMIDKMFMPGQFNISSMFVNPQQEFEDTMANQTKQWDTDWLKNQIAWSGSFGKLMGDEINTDSAQFNSMASSLVGKVGGSMLGGAM